MPAISSDPSPCWWIGNMRSSRTPSTTWPASPSTIRACGCEVRSCLARRASPTLTAPCGCELYAQLFDSLNRLWEQAEALRGLAGRRNLRFSERHRGFEAGSCRERILIGSRGGSAEMDSLCFLGATSAPFWRRPGLLIYRARTLPKRGRLAGWLVQPIPANPAIHRLFHRNLTPKAALSLCHPMAG